MEGSRFEFRSNTKYDIALLAETEAVNPFAYQTTKRKPAWTEVANHLMSSNLKMPVTSRSCRERVAVLLKAFRKDENLSSRASGISEEELTEVKSLLIKVNQLEKTINTGIQRLYSAPGRKEAERTRENAVKLIQLEDSPDEESEPGEAEKQIVLVAVEVEPQKENPNTGPAVPPEMKPSAKKRKLEDKKVVERTQPSKAEGDTPPRPTKTDAFAYLASKNKGDLEFKNAELQQRKMESDNKRYELELQAQKQEQDFKLKEAEQKERSAMTQALLDFLKNK